MLIRRRDTRPKGTPSRATHPRGIHRSMPPSTASHRRSSSNINLVVPASWKDVWLLFAAAVSWMHASDERWRNCVEGFALTKGKELRPSDLSFGLKGFLDSIPKPLLLSTSMFFVPSK